MNFVMRTTFELSQWVSRIQNKLYSLMCIEYTIHKHKMQVVFNERVAHKSQEFQVSDVILPNEKQIYVELIRQK